MNGLEWLLKCCQKFVFYDKGGKGPASKIKGQVSSNVNSKITANKIKNYQFENRIMQQAQGGGSGIYHFPSKWKRSGG